MHTCGHPSDRPYIEMCRSGCLSNTVCPDIGQDDTPRKSHFPCYACIKSEARAETEALARATHSAALRAHEARNTAVREKHAAELRAKDERIRREAREKAAREREEEARVRVIKETEEERAKKDGGAWIETSGGKKTKSRKGGVVGSPVPADAGSPVLKMVFGRERKENEGATNASPKMEKVADQGRAGIWGPKKILSRKENTAAAKK
jgi:hypothetical protein